MGNVLHVELPVGLDEQQMQAILSTPDLRKRQPVSTKSTTKLTPFAGFRADIGRFASRTMATTGGLWRCDSPPLVDLGVSHPFRTHIGFRNLADNDQPSDLVAARFLAPGKDTDTLAQC